MADCQGCARSIEEFVSSIFYYSERPDREAGLFVLESTFVHIGRDCLFLRAKRGEMSAFEFLGAILGCCSHWKSSHETGQFKIAQSALLPLVSH